MKKHCCHLYLIILCLLLFANTSYCQSTNKALATKAQFISDTLVNRKNERKAEFRKGYSGRDFQVDDTTDLIFLLDTMGLRKIYNDAKWRIYCLCCQDTMYFTDYARNRFGFKEFVLLGEQNIELHRAGDRREGFQNPKLKKTIMARCELFFEPSYVNFDSLDEEFQLLWPNNIVRHYKMDKWYYINYLFPQLYYTDTNAEKPFVIRGDTWGYSINPNSALDCKTRHTLNVLDDPMQPDIILYIREHANKINRWFYNEAKKRGVFDSVKYPPAKILQEIEHNRTTAHKDCYDPPPRTAESPEENPEIK